MGDILKRIGWKIIVKKCTTSIAAPILDVGGSVQNKIFFKVINKYNI